MKDILHLPEDMPDRGLYFKRLSKEYSMPLDAIWALYNSDITEEEFYQHLEECDNKNWYGWADSTIKRNKKLYGNRSNK